MSEDTPVVEEVKPTNFIRQIIDRDLEEHKFTSIRTRFPPEPNGYLHVGHAKSICLNFGLARDYNGKCNLRFDDTNPSKEDTEYVDSIKQDVEWLGFKWDGEPKYSSNYFDKLYGYAVELINQGLAYVDELSPDEIREYRGTLTQPGRNSPYRDRSVEENLALFEKMKNGEFKDNLPYQIPVPPSDRRPLVHLSDVRFHPLYFRCSGRHHPLNLHPGIPGQPQTV